MKHIARMIIGFILYHIFMRLPAGWWITENGWFFWLLPTIGYYAYHPGNLKWYEAMK